MFAFILFIKPCDLNRLSFKAMYLPHGVAMQFGYDQDIPQDICSYKLLKSEGFYSIKIVSTRGFKEIL